MIKTFEALRVEKVLTGGRTKPVVVECRPLLNGESLIAEESVNDAENQLMVLRALGPEVTEKSLFCELTGNLIARELGISTPEPGFIILSNGFTNQVNLVLSQYGLKIQAGTGVGCSYTSPLLPITERGPLKPEEIDAAALIYAFDLLVQNSDRRIGNPNCAFHDSRLLAFDFELCFSFLYPLIGAAPPFAWEVSKLNISSNHIFRSRLKAKNPDWKPFMKALKTLCKKRLEVIISSLPENWQEWGQAVQAHFQSVMTKLNAFEIELQRSLL